MNCPGSERVMAFIDGELSPEEQASVREHIAGCTACRRLIQYQKLIEDTWRESYISPSDFEFNAFKELGPHCTAGCRSLRCGAARSEDLHHRWPL